MAILQWTHHNFRKAKLLWAAVENLECWMNDQLFPSLRVSWEFGVFVSLLCDKLGEDLWCLPAQTSISVFPYLVKICMAHQRSKIVKMESSPLGSPLGKLRVLFMCANLFSPLNEDGSSEVSSWSYGTVPGAGPPVGEFLRSLYCLWWSGLILSWSTRAFPLVSGFITKVFCELLLTWCVCGKEEDTKPPTLPSFWCHCH